VQSKDHDPLDPTPGHGSQAEQASGQEPDWPRQEGNDCREHGAEDSKEGTGQRESGAGSDVIGGLGQEDHGQDREQRQQTGKVTDRAHFFAGSFSSSSIVLSPFSSLPARPGYSGP